MDETELLQKIYPTCIQRVTFSLAKDASVSEKIKSQLESFFQCLSEFVASGDTRRLDSTLSGWASSLTVTDLESGQSSIYSFIREVMLRTYQVCLESLEVNQAHSLIATLLSAFAHAFEKAAFFESQVRVAYVSKQLKQAQTTLERLDRSKSDFISVAAHELRTPLTLIEGYSDMLRELHSPIKNGAYEAELMSGIHNGVHRLQAIIDDMIDVSLIDNDLMQLNFQPVWINRLFSILKTELDSATNERDQTLSVQDFPGSSDMIYADPDRLLQVFRNVLTNAIKFTPDGGKISIDGRKLPGFLEIVIRDSGIGINPQDHSIIFDKFTRLGNISLHSSGKTKFKGGGPGLGLHIAKGIIEAHGGAIWAESPGYDEEKKPGSTFHILLPHLSEPPESHLARLLPNLSNEPGKENI